MRDKNYIEVMGEPAAAFMSDDMRQKFKENGLVITETKYINKLEAENARLREKIEKMGDTIGDLVIENAGLKLLEPVYQAALTAHPHFQWESAWKPVEEAITAVAKAREGGADGQ
jgi:hypothetical protein